MTFKKRKKDTRQRGTHTHGWGAKKKHRGAGSRGGRGKAGTGKRADTRKPSYWKEKYFGKFGFKKKGQQEKIMIINIEQLAKMLEGWVKKGTVKKDGDSYVLDLTSLGYTKLLGKGKINQKCNITVKYASAQAQEKIKSKDGKVTITSTVKDQKQGEQKSSAQA